MRYVYFANNRVGHEVVRWLVERGERPVALVVHPASRAKHRQDIIDATELAPEYIFEGPMLRDPTTVAALRQLRPELGLSVLFDYILRPEILAVFPRGCLNLHPALLPYNRGQYPNVWSIVEGTPAGVTLHYMDEGIDTGDIVAQCEVPVTPTDTGESLYRKLEAASLRLFREVWPRVVEETASSVPQPHGVGTNHRTRDVDYIDAIDLDAVYTARYLINVLRARTFPPYPGAYFVHEGRRIYLRLILEEEAGLEALVGDRQPRSAEAAP